MTKKQTITWFVPERPWKRFLRPWSSSHWHPDHSLGSVWIRGHQIAPYLQQKDYSVLCNKISPLPDIAVFLRRYGAEDVLLAQRLKNRGAKIIVDVVANYFSQASSQQKDPFLKLIGLADQIWTVSPFLKEAASAHHPDVHFIPDSVNPHHFYKRNIPNTTTAEKPPLTIGWAGVSPKASFLAMLTPILRPAIEQKKLRVMIISDSRPQLSFPFEFRRWRYSCFPRDISTCDLCVAPRDLGNDYEKSHSFFKIGVFMAMGVPALASNVPSYQLLLEDGKAGAICHSPEEWEYHLSRYIATPELRMEWSRQSYQKMVPFLTPSVAEQIVERLRRFS